MNGVDLDFPVVDAHVHLYPEKLAKKVTPALSERFGNSPAFDGTIAGCKIKSAADGIAMSINLPVATKSESVADTNRFWMEYAPSSSNGSGSPSVCSLAAFHPLVEDKGRAMEQIAAAGFTGVKFHPEYQMFRYNDKSMDEAWDAMSELGLVAYLHAGGERVFNPPYHSTPTEIATLQKRFPKLDIVAAHLGGFGMWDEVEEILAGGRVHLDLAHTFFWMPDAQILRMIRRHGAERILFGTDAPWQNPGKVLKAFLSLPLDKREQKLICHDNAARLLRIKI